jgi:hypothetical protein
VAHSYYLSYLCGKDQKDCVQSQPGKKINSISIKISQAWWYILIIPAKQEAMVLNSYIVFM